ncbi:hypothetical protein LIER_43480 [Lithospermum erythrorhizon]|uniref:Protein FAR1-RELATED SEQUENCE n=1 Tax=Lithospermum erythrorhizon TaxID=34254 RepID=A0AAV3Q752_LITER
MVTRLPSLIFNCWILLISTLKLMSVLLLYIDFEEIKISCSCRLFNNWGFLWRHIFKVMEMAASSGHHPRLRTIPRAYILKRWTRLAKGGLDIYNDMPVSSSTYGSSGVGYEQRYQQLCIYIHAIASRVCMFHKPYESFLKDIVEAEKWAEGLIQALLPLPKSDPKVKIKDKLAKGVKPAASRKGTHKRLYLKKGGGKACVKEKTI